MPSAAKPRQITKECGPREKDLRLIFALAENGTPLGVSRRNDCSGKHRAITGVTLPPAPATVSCGLMAFNALLMCREEKHLRVLGKALDDVGMEQEVCLSAPEALDLTVQKHYSALVIDFDLPGAATVARMARLAPSRRRPVIFGMIGALTEIAETFQAGANFIFYKPLGVEQMVRCLRAGRGFMR